MNPIILTISIDYPDSLKQESLEWVCDQAVNQFPASIERAVRLTFVRTGLDVAEWETKYQVESCKVKGSRK